MSELVRRLRGCLESDRHPVGLGAVDAAVAMAVSDEPEPRLLLLRRTQALRLNPGEIAFPGGKAEPGDSDLYNTALREAQEEVALPPQDFQFCGSLPRRQTQGGVSVVAMVGVVPLALPLRPDPAEVDLLLQLPLALFADPARLRVDRFWRGGLCRAVPRYNLGPHLVWGMTGAFIVELVNRFYDAGLDPATYDRALPLPVAPSGVTR